MQSTNKLIFNFKDISQPFAVFYDPITEKKHLVKSLEVFRKEYLTREHKLIETIDLSNDGFDYGGCKVFFLYDTDFKEITGIVVLGIAYKPDSKESKKVHICEGTGLLAHHIKDKPSHFVLATNQMDIFFKAFELNEMIVFHKNLELAFNSLNEFANDETPRIILSDQKHSYHDDLTLVCDKNILEQSKDEFKKLIQKKAKEIRPSLAFDDEKNDWLPPAIPHCKIYSPYPIQVIPNVARQAIIAISEKNKIAIEIVAQSVLYTMTFIAQRKINVINLAGQIMPVSLFFLCEAESGERKSTADRLATDILSKLQQKAYTEFLKELKIYENTSKKNTAENLLPPQDPRQIFTDITVEALLNDYINGNLVNCAIASDEAALIFGGHTMKSDTSTNATASFIKIFDNGIVERKRSKSNANGAGGIAYDCRLTINLLGQQCVIKEVFNHPILKDQGFLPRFLFFTPLRLAGTRTISVIDIKNSLRIPNELKIFWNRCEELIGPWMPNICTDVPDPINTFDDSQKREVLEFSEDAYEVLCNIANHFEENQRDDETYCNVKAFASRATELVIRLSGVFAFFDRENTISSHQLTNAFEIVKLSVNNWVNYGLSQEDRDAYKIMSDMIHWSKENEHSRGFITYSEIQRRCIPKIYRKASLLKPLLDKLQSYGQIHLFTANKTQYIQINPYLLE